MYESEEVVNVVFPAHDQAAEVVKSGERPLDAPAPAPASCSGLDIAGTGYLTSYTMDGLGNLLSVSQGSEARAFTWDTLSRLSTPQNAEVSSAYRYVYDGESRITSAYTGSTTVGTYVYGAQGERVYETVGGAARGYLYGDSGQQLTVVDGSGNLIAGETYVAGRYLGTQTPGGFVAAFGDNLGTVRYRQTGETDTSWAFGEASATSNATSPIHFTGKPKDIETGLDYFGARYYSSPLGRFMTPDWSASPEAVPYATLANPQSLNLYAYVQNNPVTDLDPDGHLVASPAGLPPLLGDFGAGTANPALLLGEGAAEAGYLDNQVLPAQFQFHLDHAAMSAEKQALALTRAGLREGVRHEYGGWLIQNKTTGVITNTQPQRGNEGEIDLTDPTPPTGYTTVGQYHTHPDTTAAEGDGAAPGDVNNLRVIAGSYRIDIPGYVGNAFSGSVYRYTEHTPISNTIFMPGPLGVRVGTIPQ